MCGIAGFIGTGSREVLERMTRALSYRGPDGEGYFFVEDTGVNGAVALGHRRLSIIDVGGGAQPQYNEARDVSVVFNGEIYNFRSLRRELKKRHTFTTESDTEVIVHLYEEKGPDAVQELEGMFAFALWDAKKKLLLLARDRFGEKPLYYGRFGDTLVFGSELKALVEHPAVEREIDSLALQKYFHFEYVPAPHTIFKNIYKLEAGHYLVFQDGKVEVEEYWNMLDRATSYQLPATSINEEEAVRELDAKLNEAVKKMLVSDVPLGIFLSGGLDSSTVAYYAQKNSARPVQTFSIGFEEATFDESVYAERVAERIGSEHTTEMVGARDLLEIIPKAYALLDEPMADPSLVPTYALSRFARKHVTVALGGDGSDELFMGYQTFQALWLSRYYRLLPRPVREHLVRPLVNMLPTSFSYLSADFLLKKFVNDFNLPLALRNQIWIGAFSPTEVEELFSREVSHALTEDITRHAGRVSELDDFHQLSYIYTKQFLQDYIIAKVDRASMFNSLEVRAPFLDPALASFVFALPWQMKVHGRSRRFPLLPDTKHILKKLMADRLGNDIVYRSKQGFQPPVARWLKDDLHDLVDYHLSPDRLRAEGLFNAAYVAQLLFEHRAGKTDHRKKLWTLLVFQMWKERFGG